MSAAGTATSDPHVAELRTEIAELRRAVNRLRADIAAEVRTRRLVVVDDDGAERIETTVTEYGTMLTLTTTDTSDVAGLSVDYDGQPLAMSRVELVAEVDTGDYDGSLGLRAHVTCNTGDNSWATLLQRTITSRGAAGGTMTARDVGTLRLDQTERQGSRRTTGLQTRTCTDIEVGPDGVVERKVGGDLVAFSLMQRAVR